ncbi:helix-turn-helix domain-containing protein [Staphylococcus saprophyticus]|uniref:helix-turn-helix domain-containing protein n=1 Tax=Staphylococcus saprophyticus TaxID=29385 RepID=UPI000990336A|nr:helix-turn-helix transcriptional regulator [Staphylococcus saprophyticus]OOO72388.1 hypothetical protein B0W56_00430 [Staphylococcus saprophyticus]
MIQLNEYIKKLRTEKKIGCREISNLIGYSHGHVSQMENGVKPMRLQFLNKYLKGVSNSDDEFKYIAKEIKEKFNINITYTDEVDYTDKQNIGVNLNNVTNTKLVIDGKELSVLEKKFVLSIIRGYRNV